MNLSIFDDAGVAGKLRAELEGVSARDEDELERFIILLLDMCDTARSEGFHALRRYERETDEPVLRTMLVLLSKDWLDKTGRPADLYFWVKPMLLSGKNTGTQFVKSALAYEGIYLSVDLGLGRELLRFRLNAMIGKFLDLKELLEE